MTLTISFTKPALDAFNLADPEVRKTAQMLLDDYTEHANRILTDKKTMMQISRELGFVLDLPADVPVLQKIK